MGGSYVLLYSKLTSFLSSEEVSEITFGSICYRSLWTLLHNVVSTTVLTWGFTSGLSLQSAAASDFGGDRVCKRL